MRRFNRLLPIVTSSFSLSVCSSVDLKSRPSRHAIPVLPSAGSASTGRLPAFNHTSLSLTPSRSKQDYGEASCSSIRSDEHPTSDRDYVTHLTNAQRALYGMPPMAPKFARPDLTIHARAAASATHTALPCVVVPFAASPKQAVVVFWTES